MCGLSNMRRGFKLWLAPLIFPNVCAFAIFHKLRSEVKHHKINAQACEWLSALYEVPIRNSTRVIDGLSPHILRGGLNVLERCELPPVSDLMWTTWMIWTDRMMWMMTVLIEQTRVSLQQHLPVYVTSIRHQVKLTLFICLSKIVWVLRNPSYVRIYSPLDDSVWQLIPIFELEHNCSYLHRQGIELGERAPSSTE